MVSTKFYCASCGVEFLVDQDSECINCGGTEVIERHVSVPIGLEKSVLRAYNTQIASKANGYVASEYKCICGGDHYMVWPGVRDSNNYSDISKLTNLPMCPSRLWDHANANGMGMSRRELLETLKVKNE